MYPAPEGVTALDYAWQTWSGKTRYIGVGAMVVGGIWVLIKLGNRLIEGIRSGLVAWKTRAENTEQETLNRQDKDVPMHWVMRFAGLAIIPLTLVFYMVCGNFVIAAIMAVVMGVAGFLFSAVASYMAGLVGSSNNPVSGVTIATLLFSSLLLLGLGLDSVAGPASAIMIGAVVCCAAAIGGDNIQDLKCGHILGATPWKQQVMQVVGVLAAALVMAPVLTLLLSAYGIVEPAGPDREPLAAPQATLMASVAKGVFSRNLPWVIVMIGMMIAVVVIVMDLYLEKRGSTFRMPVLAVAVGIYLPLELETAILLGGLVSWFAARFWSGKIESTQVDSKSRWTEKRESSGRSGLLFAAGLITGEAVLGIMLAIPIVLNQGVNPLQLTGENGHLPTSLISFFPSVWPGLFLFIGVTYLLWRIARNTNTRSE